MYLVIKTSEKKIKEEGSLFNAAKGHWYVNPQKASNCTHVIVTLKGSKDIKAVYKVNKWEHSFYSRYHFEGCTDTNLEKQLIGKTLTPALFIKGRKNPIAYIKESELLTV